MTDIFDTVQLEKTGYCKKVHNGQWSVTLPKHRHLVRFHLVLKGHCNVTLSNKQTITLQPGELLLIADGKSHNVSSIPSIDGTSEERDISLSPFSGNTERVSSEMDLENRTEILYGYFGFRNEANFPILSFFPDEFLVTVPMRNQNLWLGEFLKIISKHNFDLNGGTQGSLRRLYEILFIEILRSCLSDITEAKSILRGMQDPHINKALKLIHNDPSISWSVKRLAEEVGMSRSRFAERFGALIGQGPISYLTDWRLQKAVTLLRQNDVSIQQIAILSGYQSSAAFTRAFSEKYGASPKTFRLKI
ncbi:AraC family transcriptional regulator [Sneathiella aquimaris]|uniref:AraC family transcriptional regulator n=1 Tax=Sneathiella aquimaris TaxID=2599305 RepID=UPI00146A3906|nr:AraC family transcriptional regulator [Sneathiella aquimaris]